MLPKPKTKDVYYIRHLLSFSFPHILTAHTHYSLKHTTNQALDYPRYYSSGIDNVATSYAPPFELAGIVMFVLPPFILPLEMEN
jgi:hypothetical protein